MVQHALERGWIKPPISEAYESPSYIEALIELARDARWSTCSEPTRNALLQHLLEKFLHDYIGSHHTVMIMEHPG